MRITSDWTTSICNISVEETFISLTGNSHWKSPQIYRAMKQKCTTTTTYKYFPRPLSVSPTSKPSNKKSHIPENEDNGSLKSQIKRLLSVPESQLSKLWESEQQELHSFWGLSIQFIFISVLFRCASISWLQIVSGSVSEWVIRLFGFSDNQW